MFSHSTFSVDPFCHQIVKCKNKFCLCGPKNSESAEVLSFKSSDENEGASEKYDSYNEQLVSKPTTKLSLWNTILKESDENKALVYEWKREHMKPESDKKIDHDSFIQYLNEQIFPILLPTMEQMLIEASQRNALKNQRCLFNGLDYLAHRMWNENPQHPERNKNWLQLFHIPPFKHWLKEHPRPVYPKSWLWTREQAALHIQRYVRGWIVRKRNDIRELREFWKAIAAEGNIKNIKIVNKNPTANAADIPRKIQELSICDQYKLLTKLYNTFKK